MDSQPPVTVLAQQSWRVARILAALAGAAS
jgi:hypothetical protein